MASGNAFKIGGRGVDGEEVWIAEPRSVTLKKDDVQATLSANAVGAVSYRWTKNGEAIEGGEDGDLVVAWVRRGSRDVYAVTPVYDVYGVETEGEPRSCTVFNQPLGMAVIIR